MCLIFSGLVGAWPPHPELQRVLVLGGRLVQHKTAIRHKRHRETFGATQQ
jgi:hypothetical protein